MGLVENRLPSELRFELPPPRAIAFEPAGVLYDASPRRRWLWQLVSRRGLKTNYEVFSTTWEGSFLPSVLRGDRPYADALNDFLVALGLSVAELREIEAAMPLRGEPLEWGERALPGVARALAQLADLVPSLAILCDCALPGDELKKHLDDLGLGHHFTLVVTSVDLGITKPSSQNFGTVSGMLHLHPAQCAFVGTRREDLAGASQAGWQTLSLGAAAEGAADLSVNNLAELVTLARRWAPEPLRVAS